MTYASIFLAILYTCTILSLVWGRFFFFKVKSQNTRLSAILYDPVVVVHIGYSYLSILDISRTPALWAIVVACLIYIASLLLFWWGINTAKQLNFAYGDFKGELITSGPFQLLRHPFYLSYMLIWSTSTFLFNSLPLWITLFYLVAFYLSSAKSEEKTILSGEQANIYRAYYKKTNMFIPRIKLWKS